MKFVIVFAAVVAVSAAQFYQQTRPQLRPILPPQPSPFPRPSSLPPRPTSLPPRPSVQPVTVNRVASNDQNANVIRYDNDIYPDGSFRYAFETDNGIGAQAEGTPRQLSGNPPVAPVVIQGSFSWTSPEGQPIVITYIADENGYQPQGDSIPTPPPIPVAILKALDYIAKNPYQQK